MNIYSNNDSSTIGAKFQNDSENDNSSKQCDGSMILCSNLCVCTVCQSLPIGQQPLTEQQYIDKITGYITTSVTVPL